MRKFLLILLVAFTSPALAQQFNFKIVSARQTPVAGATIELKRKPDSTLVKTAITDKDGAGKFEGQPAGEYFLVVAHVGYETLQTETIPFPNNETKSFVLDTKQSTMQSVTVTSRKPFIQQVQGKTVVNVDAMISNAGTTVLELLEKSPGVLVDRNGGISMQNKAGVLVMIDDKPTYLSGTDLTNMLSSMSSSQIEQIELITNPSARYDAAGNAGIINIKTKKNKQIGFNGNFTVSGGTGRYYKNNNSLVMNYRNGRYNSFLTYSNNNSKHYTEMYALRTYFDSITGNKTTELDQPTLFLSKFNNHNLKLGIDYFLSTKTTIGLALSGNMNDRNGSSRATATWLNAVKNIDSAILTKSTTAYDLLAGTITVYGKHSFNKKNELSVDADMLNYDIKNNQLFTNEGMQPAYYYEGSRGELPSTLKILSAKTDYIWKFGKESQLEAGAKIANTKTDNLANYSISAGGPWEADPGRSNHFIYDENIKAVYSSVQQKFKRWSYQAGMRFENTSYTGRQLGNGAAGNDSTFNNDYTSLFPSGFVSFEADSNHSFTVTFSRRLDRPPFQKLNPFFFTINKYTYEQGNPFTRPQFSWNFELSHLFKQKITTTLSYSFTKDYYSQIFFKDSSFNNEKLIIYSTGNVGKAFNIGASVSAQINVNKWWFFTAQSLYNYKKLMGYVWRNFNSDVHQFNFNMNNQFKIGKNYTAELSGFYTGRARNDLQEILYPISQVVVAAARPVLKKKATLKLSVRDIFHKNGMEGLSDFENSTEYFWVKRDSRVATISFTYRFGKPFKMIRRNSGSAADEMQRAGS